MSSDANQPDDFVTRAEMRQEMAKLRRRIAELEEGTTTTNKSSSDPREQAVLDALAGHEGETITVTQLKEVYRRATDVSNNKTLQRRVKQLTNRSEFESVSGRGATWRFVGSGGDE